MSHNSHFYIEAMQPLALFEMSQEFMAVPSAAADTSSGSSTAVDEEEEYRRFYERVMCPETLDDIEPEVWDEKPKHNPHLPPKAPRRREKDPPERKVREIDPAIMTVVCVQSEFLHALQIVRECTQIAVKIE